MKLGLFAALAGIAVTIGLSRSKRSNAVPAPIRKRPRTPAPRKRTPVTGTAPQEGVSTAP